MAAQLILMNGLSRRELALVERGGDQLLAGAALAGDEDGGGRVGDLVDDPEHVLHLEGLADQRADGRSRRGRCAGADSWVRIAFASTSLTSVWSKGLVM